MQLLTPPTEGPVTALAFDPTGRLLASANRGSVTDLWELAGDPVPRSVEFPRFGHQVTGIAFDPDSTALIACRHVGHTGQPQPRLGYWRLDDLGTFHRLDTRVGRGAALALEPDGEHLIVFGFDRSDSASMMERWRIADWKRVPLKEGKRLGTRANWAMWFTRREPASLATGKKWVAVATTESPHVGFQNRQRPGRIRTFKPHPTSIRALAVHPLEHTLVTAGPREARVWKLPEWTKLHELPRSGSQFFNALAFSPDGRTLAVGRNSGMITYWDTTTWEETATFTWPIGHVRKLAFAPDGLRIAAGGESGKVIVWDVE